MEPSYRPEPGPFQRALRETRGVDTVDAETFTEYRERLLAVNRSATSPGSTPATI